MSSRYRHATDRDFDIVVVGAGMFGACIAHNAAQRGYSVAIVDKGDFGAATSSNHYKMIHGGIRYLQHLDLPRLRESSLDRATLLKVAPHLAQPLPIVFPTYGHGRRSKALMRAAMLAYDILTLDRNRKTQMVDRKIPSGSVLSRDELLNMFPGVRKDGLTGAAVFYDGQMYNPARMVLAFIQSAMKNGAVALNYARVDQLISEDARVIGCRVTDVPTGESFNIRGRIVVNATGPWGDSLLSEDIGLDAMPEFSFSRDLAFVVDKSLSPTHAIGCQIDSADSDAILDRGGRHLFLVPWRDKTLVGVWHRHYESGPEGIAVSDEELQEFVDEINAAYEGLDISTADIRRVNTGLVLFGSKDDQNASGEHSFAKRSLVIDHSKNGVDGLVTVVGVRATVASSVAEETVDLVDRKIGAENVQTSDRWQPIFGGEFESFATLTEEIRQQLPSKSRQVATAIAHNYGSEYANMFSCASNSDYLETLGDTNVVAAEVINAVRNEMAINLEDVMLRRTELATAGHPGANVIEKVASLIGRELGWNASETDAQIHSVRELIDNLGPWQMVQESSQIGTGHA